jgi:hypothetical protein
VYVIRVSSAAWIVVLTVAGAIAALAPNLSDRDRVGALAIIVLCGAAAIYVQRREVRKQERAQEERDDAFKRLVNTIEQRLPVGSPERQTFGKQVGAILQNYTSGHKSRGYKSSGGTATFGASGDMKAQGQRGAGMGGGGKKTLGFKTGDVVSIHEPGPHHGETGKVCEFFWPFLYTIELADGQRVQFPFDDLRKVVKGDEAP